MIAEGYLFGGNPVRKISSKSFQVQFVGHAEAILRADFGGALSELDDALSRLVIPIEEIVSGGGGEAASTQRLRKEFTELGWPKRNFVITKIVGGVEKGSISHEVDHVRESEEGVIALEIEWNNKDPFFDRDLDNFKRLHSEGVISVGVIVTRGRDFQEQIGARILAFVQQQNIIELKDLEPFLSDLPTRRQQKLIQNKIDRRGIPFAQAWAEMFVADKFGSATTHWNKLSDRISRGVGSPCPLLLIGIPITVIS